MRGWNKRWNKEKIIKEIHELVRQGVDISQKNMKKQHKALFGAAVQKVYFNGWRKAVEKAGYRELYNRCIYECRSKHNKKQYSWSREKIIERVKLLRDKGIPLDRRSVEENDPGLISTVNKKRFFSCWKEAVEQIGVDYDALIKETYRSRRKKRPPFKDKLLNKAVAAWQKELKFRGHAKEVRAGRLADLRRFDEFLAPFYLSQLTQEDIKRYLLFKKNMGCSATTLRSIHLALKSLYKFCLNNQIVDFDPTAGIFLPKVSFPIVLPPTEEELRKFLKYVGSREKGSPLSRIRDKVIIQLMVFAGLRRRELADLKMKDVDFEKRLLFIKWGKGRKDRIMPLNGECISTLQEYLAVRKRCKIKNLFVTSYMNRPLCCGAIGKILRSLSIESGNKIKFAPNTLRHSFASLLLSNGVGIETIGKMMGHTSLLTTYRYIHASPEYLRKEIRKHPLIGDGCN